MYMKRLLLSLITVALSFSSCRSLVLENRTDCPSFLYFQLANSERFEAYDNVYLNVYAHPKGLQMDAGHASVANIQTENLDEKFHFVVRSTMAVKGYGLIGSETMTQNGSEWTVPPGWDYAPLYRATYMENVREESFTVPIEFVKEYCHVKVRFIGYETFLSAMGRFPFYILIRSNTAGIDGFTGVPVRAPFEFRPKEKSIGFFEFNLPRQGDKNLVMELYGQEGYAERTGHTATFDLYADLLDQGGMTWTEKNLPDVDIVIDYQEHTVNVSVSPWSQETINYEY